MASAQGVVAMENSGHLTAEKWQATGDEALRLPISRIERAPEPPEARSPAHRSPASGSPARP
ncbi:hypothetical protein APASM_2254 [Actinosynnema pretiosum subsp. pretiosum]|nr:hypothetical protein APASM_2254 [Actinosynnema pretiosum subsp. pretiosum]